MRLLLLPRWLAARCWLHNEFHLLSRLFDLERAIFIPALPLLSDRGVAALAVEWLALVGGMFRMSSDNFYSANREQGLGPITEHKHLIGLYKHALTPMANSG
ncbi:hypothetical protein LSTR_LSTR009453 [Laodelphax striatellus]|uniref:Uncharacterized protein n=1 Tax=Laodelphax striatellus TaxID=195883 RepID=A0A482X565_LAOST|nr:hypothetical protein LSTR_LSTR009453 [Laodelphax striatellus]